MGVNPGLWGKKLETRCVEYDMAKATVQYNTSNNKHHNEQVGTAAGH
jgi:hypothetical protein